MESLGTASFPGHSFYVTPTYDRDHQMKRWVVTEDEAVLCYDPLEEVSTEGRRREEMEKLVRSGKWTERQRFYRDAWTVDRSFGRDYLVKTGNAWLANFPQPYWTDGVGEEEEAGGSSMLVPSSSGIHEGQLLPNGGYGVHMWPAEYIGQTHTVQTSNLYYTALPDTLDRLTECDYSPEMEQKRRLELGKYQSGSLKTKKADNNNIHANITMPLTLKVASVAPRVLEVKKFLSPVEVQHLIDLASGAKGDIAMQRSTVSASSVNEDKGVVANNKKVRGTKADARTSTNGWIHREQDAVVDTIFRRIADLLNVDETLLRDRLHDYPGAEEGDEELSPTHDRIVEAMQLVRYGPGEEYSAHHDFTYPSIGDRYQPKRYATVLLYLTGEGDVVDAPSNTDGLEGGETAFPRAVTTDFHDGVKVAPQSGKAVVFYNVLPDGNMDDLSQHAGGKVEKGVKYVANVWVWDPIVN